MDPEFDKLYTDLFRVFTKAIRTYDQRVVLRFEDKPARLLVSTAKVSDGFQPFETGVAHPRYNGGRMVIVEAYPTAEAARAGHARWVKAMTRGPLPDSLQDCINCRLAQELRSMGGLLPYPRQDLAE